jgi:NitT/TauT family transport system substrate-binding protein
MTRAGALVALAVVLAAAAGCGSAPSAPNAPQGQGSAAPAAATAQSAPARIELVYAQPSAAFTPIFVAADQGFFRQEGLDVHMTQVTGTAAVAALTSGEAQVQAGGATEVAAVDVAGGDLAILATGSNYPVFSLYVNKSIRSVQDLAGKKIAVTRLGTSTDTTARIILEHYGLTGKVQVVGAGGTMSDIMAAMQQGVVAGGVVSPPTTAKAEAAGFQELVNGFKLGVPMNQSSIAVRRSFLAQHRDTVLRFLRAYLRAWAFIRDRANQAATVKSIADHTQSSQQEAAVAYEAFYPVWAQTKVPSVDTEGVRNVLRFSTNAQVQRLDPASLVDTSVLDELVRSGYVDSLYRK